MREVVGVAVTVPSTAPSTGSDRAVRRVLAARRSAPADVAGRWELPGGKVEPGETAAGAAVREVHEELGCEVEVTGLLEGRSELRTDLALVGVAARLVAGDPVPREHGAVRWLRADQLDEVDWIEADRVFLPALRRLLAGEPAGEEG
ncbi:MAG: (deoxy)nucleoside triphosphate pyrophosphohydrolase [Marmoricola sp.]|nr:(deoxy)nucleoside triphosphate pyrophosphohydrolase [Marmoricola sp.]